jgi:hypothetical protein
VTVSFQLVDVRPQEHQEAVLFHEWTFPDGSPWTRFYRTGPDYLLRFPDLADFQVSNDGCSVHCWPVPEISDETIQHLYLNQVLPLAISKQGKLVFHASAVEVGEVGIAFMGESGRGKSTLAASFATNGYRFLTDDGLVLNSVDGECRIMPSQPSIRLWQDSQDALVNGNAQMAPPVEYTSKSRLLAGDNMIFCPHPRRLQRVFFLGEEKLEKPVFLRLKPNEALIELVKHSFLLDIEEREMLAAHFQELSNLVRQSNYYRLDYPRRFEDLAHIRQAIVDHLHVKDAENESV